MAKFGVTNLRNEAAFTETAVFRAIIINASVMCVCGCMCADKADPEAHVLALASRAVLHARARFSLTNLNFILLLNEVNRLDIPFYNCYASFATKTVYLGNSKVK